METMMTAEADNQSQPQPEALGEGGAVSEETQPRQEEGVYTPNDPFLDSSEVLSQGADEESQPSEVEEGEEEGGQESPNLPEEIYELLPEKFRKADDPLGALVKSYSEAEKTLSQLQNQVHQYEQALQQLIMQGGQEEQERDFSDISDDEIITGKELKEYLNRVLRSQISPVLEQAQLEQAKAQLKAQHPDYEEIIQLPEFAEFAQSLPPQVIQMADVDPNVASWVLSQYKAQRAQEAQQAQKAQESAVRREKLNQLSQPTTKKPAGERVFRASELRRLMVENPEEYARIQGQVIRAIQEGRFIND